MSKAKRIFYVLMGIATISWSIGLPSLVNALSVTNVTVSTTSAEIQFDGPVQRIQGDLTGQIELGDPTTAANDLRNYIFKTGDPLSLRILSRFSPYNMTTQYIDGDNKLRIYGLKNLHLNQGEQYQWQIEANKIRHATSTDVFVDAYNVTSTIVASTDPVIDYVANNDGHPYGTAGCDIEIHGLNFATSTDEVILVWQTPSGNVTSSPTSVSADGTVITAIVPSELDGVNGNIFLGVENHTQNDIRLSDYRPFAIWDTASTGLIVGSVSSTVSTDIDDVEVRAFLSGQMGGEISTKTHSNGKYALVVDEAGDYNLTFRMPAGATKAAPSKVSGQTVSIGSVTSVAEQVFLSPVLGGYIKTPDGSEGVEGAEIQVHTMDWTNVWSAITASDGSWHVYVPNTSDNQCYEIEVKPSDYSRFKLGYLGTRVNVCLAKNETNLNVNINLTLRNVKVTIKTPTGTQSDANPYPDTPVPYANVGLHTLDWSYEQWTTTDSNGVAYFGGVTTGDNYVLEIEPPFEGDFSNYARTRIEDLSISVTEGQITDLGIKRFSLPNVWGVVKCNDNPVQDAWIDLNSEGKWFGTNTDTNGKFKLGGVTLGEYYIHINPPASCSCSSYSGKISIDSETANDLGTFNLATPNITGYVKDPTGSIGQAWVWLDFCPTGPGECYGTQTSGEEGTLGKFSINVPDGTWKLNVHPNWGSIYVSPAEMEISVSGDTVTCESDPSNALSISGGNNLTILLLDPSVNGLKGRVCLPGTSEADCADESKDVGVPNVGVNLRPTTGMTEGGFMWTQTDQNGYYAFGGVSTGTYEIEANPWGGCGATACSLKTVTVNITSESESRIKNIILASPNITGVVYLPGTTTPVPNAWVNLHQEGPMTGPGGWYGSNTNDQGQFSFGGVKAGTYVLEIEPPHWGENADQYRQYSIRTSSPVIFDGKPPIRK